LEETKIKVNKKELASVKQVALDLYDKSVNGKMVLDLPTGYHIEVDRRKQQEVITEKMTSPPILDKTAFNESFDYLKNAQARFDTKTAEGYSNCKADCRNALMSTIKTLTGMNTIKEAAKELQRQGILGEREGEFIVTFDKLLGILHGIDSKKGSHPPMTRSEDDADFALGITTSVIDYIINQSTRPRV